MRNAFNKLLNINSHQQDRDLFVGYSYIWWPPIGEPLTCFLINGARLRIISWRIPHRA